MWVLNWRMAAVTTINNLRFTWGWARFSKILGSVFKIMSHWGNLIREMDPSPHQLWATASKEWVIRPKPKRGRKFKKDLAPVQQQEEQVDSKGKRVQNRSAQRAFRQRKQAQLADLQARVHSYEQGEIERNIALQSIAKRLKEENEALRQVNAILKEKVASIEQEHNIFRGRNQSPASSVASTGTHLKKYQHHGLQDTEALRLSHPYISSPQSIHSNPSTNARFSPVPADHPSDAFGPFCNLTSAFRPVDWALLTDCGACARRDMFAGKVNHVRPIGLGTLPQEATTIIDNLPPYQPPVSLWSHPRAPMQSNTIFQVFPPSQPLSTPVNCSGDPFNCPAFTDDSFGKAFCEKIGLAPCSNCPCAPGDVFGVGPPLPSQHFDSPSDTSTPSRGVTSRPDAEMIPTNEAWQHLKSHPDIACTDLAMPADFVAQSKCTGPRIVPSPPPPVEEHIETSVAAGTNSEEPILLTDPHAHFREQERARACQGRRGLREAQVGAVLDPKF
ncbi:hypothetical protein B0H17DRAFT_1179999 [Mycena rosella]|uniref:BZIP domain-containing protein n=1 Tax=Mycena rosella TaxID=1033263 RepID=A0AAD7DH15_MYCRO|nr:hypothetical protein B0H17DRAFT_1179999 [Mycena rosella]